MVNENGLSLGNHNKYKKIIIFSIILLSLGIIFLFYSHFSKSSCTDIINKKLHDENILTRELFPGKNVAIYLINAVNTCCRPLYKFSELRENPSIHVVFYVKDNFSDIDIENFTGTFNIPPGVTVKRSGPDNTWKKLLGLCRAPVEGDANFFIFIKERTMIEELVRF